VSVTEVVECLPSKCKAQSSNLSTAKRKGGKEGERKREGRKKRYITGREGEEGDSK
jgi:hypothetical protein